MTKLSAKTLKAIRNPAVRKKLQALKDEWDSLSNDEKKARIDELIVLGCPATYIATAVEKSESAIRFYKNPAKPTEVKAKAVSSPKPAVRIKPRFEEGSIEEEIRERRQAMPVRSRKDRIEDAATKFVEQYGGNSGSALQLLNNAETRCDQIEYEGQKFEPVPDNIQPADVFVKFQPGGWMNVGADVEFMAMALLQLVPSSSERQQLFSKLRQDTESRRLHN